MAWDPEGASYEQVAELSDDELRRLLHHGQPVNRVHAAWALGLRLSHALAPELVAHVHREPAPGVRRQLVVVLTGCGEQETIATLAAHDPEPEVRATACQYVARLAAPHDSRSHDLLLERAAHDPAEPVRIAAIEHLRVDAPAWVRARVLEGLPGASPAVQRAIVDRLAAWSEPPTAFLSTLHDASSELVVHALALLAEQRARVAWSEVESFAARGSLPVSIQIARVLEAGPEPAPRSFWLDIVGRWDDVVSTQPEAQVVLVEGLERAHAGVVPERLPPEERRRLEALRDDVENALRCGKWASGSWVELLELFHEPALAKTKTFAGPGARLAALLIRLTPNHRVAHRDTQHWIR
jgi:hypothetical protein